VKSLDSIGEAHFLKHAQGWLFKRTFRQFGFDLTGSYPFFKALKPENLKADLQALQTLESFIALVLVSDPLDPNSEKQLGPLFPDCFRLFKHHYGIDLTQKLEFSAHHRYYARRAERTQSFEVLVEPLQILNEWFDLYQNLILKHQIKGVRAFSKTAFQNLLQTPGLIAFLARIDQDILGIHLWMLDPAQKKAYSHLAASSKLGYENYCAYLLYQKGIAWFAEQGYHHLDLGGGLYNQSENGLAFFKQGWSNVRWPVWLCGKIFDREKYRFLTENKQGNYFPAYREGEIF